MSSKSETLDSFFVRPTAVLIIDVQNDFVKNKGKMYSPSYKSIIAPIQRLLKVAREVKVPEIYVRHVYPPDYVGLALFSRSKKLGALKRGTWGAQIIDEIKPTGGDPVIEKQRYSGFYNTNLEIILRGLDIKTLIVTGIMTNVCVESTIRDAHARDYHAILISDCTASISKEMHEATLKRMPSFCMVSTSEEAIKLITEK